MILNKNSKKFLIIILGFLFSLNLLAWVYVYNLDKDRFLEINFLDVGQGDAIFIETPNKQQILIDGGSDLTILGKLGKDMPFYDRSIDLIILSHPEKDHMFGLLEVLKRYKIKNILWTGIIRDTPEWQEWENLIKTEDAQIKVVKAGEKIILSSNPLIFFEILFPFDNLGNQEFKDSNNTSIVARLIFKEDSFLFTGDIEKSIEDKLTNRDIGSDVLKIAHHGSKTSSSEEFLKSVSPNIAVIQVGDNNYGHPHPEVLAKLDQFGIQVLRTDKNGDIKIISDGKTSKVIY